jgi:hypothetical protein
LRIARICRNTEPNTSSLITFNMDLDEILVVSSDARKALENGRARAKITFRWRGCSEQLLPDWAHHKT